MKEKKKEKEQQQQLTPAEQVKSDWRALLDKISYKAVVNNIPYLAFVALLCVIYIANNHKAVEMQREINDKKKELKELRWRDMDVKSRLIKTQKETEVIYNAEKIGLKPLALPAYTIEAESREK
jgi:cell division protein FtsL